jgi:hypothetical protein
MMNPQEKMEIKELVRKRFKNSKGEPFILTDGQAELFALIAKKKYPRNHICCHTRYGKSDVISMAVLERVNNYPEKWAIVAGKKEKAAIIMNYAIGHIFDNEFYRARFIIDKGESEENIRRYRNKSKINFDLNQGKMGEIYITTAPDAMGFGAPNVVEDESALISEKDHALVMRMLGDQPDNFLVKVGNPWESEHFRKSFEDPVYHKLIIDYHQGIREGRLKPEYVDEMRKQPFFDVLYECQFPKTGQIDEKGWIPLFVKDELDRSMINKASGFGIKKLGIDVAGGGRNYSVIVQRYSNVAKIVHKTQDPDTMNLAEEVIGRVKSYDRERKYLIRPEDIFIDRIGVGKGIYDILNREIPGIYGINAGEQPTTDMDKEKFVNLRAELYWKLRDWIMGGGKLKRDDDWYQLLKIKYRVRLEGRKGKMQIISKEELAKEGIPSPDVADALALTFRTPDIPPIDEEVLEEQIRKEEADFDPFDPFGLI